LRRNQAGNGECLSEERIARNSFRVKQAWETTEITTTGEEFARRDGMIRLRVDKVTERT
jgi:hypothetical protein